MSAVYYATEAGLSVIRAAASRQIEAYAVDAFGHRDGIGPFTHKVYVDAADSPSVDEAIAASPGQAVRSATNSFKKGSRRTFGVGQ